MAKFNIYSSGGVLKGVGCPTYTGTYMKPGVLEFREIASPTPIEWAVGDYVDYARTGFRYKLYSTPQTKRQSRDRLYGGAFLYQNVQFHDDTFILTIVPFRDLVAGDNRIHFSTQPAISVFTDVAGIAERLQANLDLNSPGEWLVRLATASMGAPAEVVALMEEKRDFAVSGVTLLGVLDKVYEVWPEIGWVFSREEVSEDVWKNVITLGGAGLNLATADRYLYGKGHGLLDITRTSANKDELANRVYAYGSSRNMLSGWYRSKPIKDAASVDIQHLMLPIGAVAAAGYPGCGQTDGLPDAAKAFVEDLGSVSKLGLREKVVYFDGSADLDEIYPTIQGMTIADVRASNPEYVPDQSWAGTERVDQVLSVGTSFDSGLAGAAGKQTVVAAYDNLTRYSPIILPADDPDVDEVLISRTFSSPGAGNYDISCSFEVSGNITCPDCTVTAELILQIGTVVINRVDVEVSGTPSGVFTFNSASITKNGVSIGASDTVTVYLTAHIVPDEVSSESRSFNTGLQALVTTYISRFRAKTFQITLRQIGFDIAERAALGSGKTIHFRTGKCAGRAFTIKGCTYQETTDTWQLEVIRSEDESLSQWFPNTDYYVAAGDEFVLLDIAMPDSYINAAAGRLLAAAKDYLAWSAREVWQYTPDIDAAFMEREGRTIRPADYMILFDSEIVGSKEVTDYLSYLMSKIPGTADHQYFLTNLEQKILLAGGGYAEAVLVDTVVVSEGDSSIPTWKVTLRERKRRRSSGGSSVVEGTAKPVAEATPNPVSTSDDAPTASYGGGVTLGFEQRMGMSVMGNTTRSLNVILDPLKEIPTTAHLIKNDETVGAPNRIVICEEYPAVEVAGTIYIKYDPVINNNNNNAS